MHLKALMHVDAMDASTSTKHLFMLMHPFIKNDQTMILFSYNLS